MRIISKYKDYYDYLSGVWGEDPLTILDRRSIAHKPIFISNRILKLHFCDNVYTGLVKGCDIHWGNEIDKFSIKGNHYSNWFYPSSKFWVVSLDDKNNRSYIPKNIEPSLVNTYFNCPIVVEEANAQPDILGINEFSGLKYSLFPLLQDYKFQKVIDDNLAYLKISEWLNKPKDLIDNQSNSGKILSNGFDIKTSFRH